MVARHIPIERSHGFALPRGRASPRTWFILEGVALTLLGVLAFALPLAAGLAAALVFGWLLILGGGGSPVALAPPRRHANVAWRLVSAIAAIVAGVLALVYPWVGAWTLALLAAAYFFVTGVAVAMVSVKLKRLPAAGPPRGGGARPPAPAGREAGPGGEEPLVGLGVYLARG